MLIAKYLDFHYFVTRRRFTEVRFFLAMASLEQVRCCSFSLAEKFTGYLINNSLRSNSLSDHAWFIGRVPHKIALCLIFSYTISL